MRKLTVLQIVGAWYSGTSLLNLLLDTQAGIRGVGEAFHAYMGKADCACSCGAQAAACPVFGPLLRRRDLYYRLREHYGCTCIVDSSKMPEFFWNAETVGCDVRRVFLSKLPHEYAWSILRKPTEAFGAGCCTVGDAFDWYVDFHQAHLRPPRRTDQMILTYRQVASDPEATVASVCAWLGLPFDAPSVAGWYDTDTHVLGGNTQVHLQVSGDRRYMEPQYAANERRIFVDEAWRKDAVFAASCAQAYERRARDLKRLLPALGHGTLDAAVADLMRQQLLAA